MWVFDQMVWVECLIIYVDGLQEFIDIKFEISVLFEDFLTIRTSRIFLKPVINALHMEYMITI